MDDLGAVIFAAYILISIYQALTKKPEAEDGEKEDEKPVPFNWDESITYDAQGNPVKREKLPQPAPAPSREAEPPKTGPAKRDPYGILADAKKPKPPVRKDAPGRKSGEVTRAKARPPEKPKPDPNRGLPDAPRSEGETTRSRRDTEHTPVRLETRETDSEHRVRELKPEVAGSGWKDVFDKQQTREGAAQRIASALRKSAPVPAAGSGVNPGAELVRMLKNPRTVSAAIIAGEVLGPPVSRRRGRRQF